MSIRPTSVSVSPRLKVSILPVLGASKNYCYVVEDVATKQAGLVDPAEPDTVVRFIEDIGISQFKVLTTHKHWDHAGGNKQLSEQFPGLEIYGGKHDDIPACTHPVDEADTFHIGGLDVKVLFAPCHTRGHVLYHVSHPEAPGFAALFTGDMIFAAGCGRFFEGNGQQMLSAMDRVSAMEPSTVMFPGHEYTVNNLKFAHSVDPDNQHVSNYLAKCERLVAEGLPTVPTTIAQERSFNPFMRVREPALQKAAGATDPVQVMDAIRSLKDKF